MNGRITKGNLVSMCKIGGKFMKILGSFIDCIYEPHLYEHNMADIRNKLVNKLPDRRICELASVLMIDTKYDMYAVKIRMCYSVIYFIMFIERRYIWISNSISVNIRFIC